MPFALLLLSEQASPGVLPAVVAVAGIIALGFVPWLVYRNRKNKRAIGIILLCLVVLFGLSLGQYTPLFLVAFLVLPVMGIVFLMFRKPTDTTSNRPDSPQ
ncbi:hypothetical protein [Hymenobacter norwichensis]|uniref:hypothetical protein n=1 Tax=Hymenobacter norwichensis TaxID=223903 RepID=UPI0003B75A4F|nr:hypothetical protein [Hymenobacter norwichensis]